MRTRPTAPGRRASGKHGDDEPAAVDGRPTVDTGYRSGDEGDPLDLTVR